MTRQQVRDEFDELVRETTGQLLRAVFLICRDAGRAEDIVQDTWLRLARRWPRVRRLDNPAGFAYRTAVNLALSERSRAARRRETSLEAVAPAVSDAAVAAVDDRSELGVALATLTPRQRAVLVLRYWEDRSEAEVADLLGCSVGTAKSTASRALKSVRNTIHAVGDTR